MTPLRCMALALALLAMLPPTPSWAAAGAGPLWVSTVGSERLPDTGQDVAVNPNTGVVYVVGYSSRPDDTVLTTSAYASDGTTLWTAIFPAAQGLAIALDSATGNVYAIGSQGGGTTVLTVAYSASGRRLWDRAYSRPGRDRNIPVAVAVGPGGQVYVLNNAGSFVGGPSVINTLAYSAAGEFLWSRAYAAPSGGSATAAGLAVDLAGVTVTGTQTGASDAVVTVAYDPSGRLRWSAAESLGTSASVGGLVSDPQSGSVFVTARFVDFVGNNAVIVTLGYAGDGRRKLALTERFPLLGTLPVVATTLDPVSRRIYLALAEITGSCCAGPDQLLIAYSLAGQRLWQSASSQPGEAQTGRVDVAIAPRNDTVYVVGGAPTELGTEYNVVTTAYDSAGQIQWEDIFDGGARTFAQAAVADPVTGNLYVTGMTIQPGRTYSDALTLAYAG